MTRSGKLGLADCLSLLRRVPALRDSLLAFVILGTFFQGFYSVSRVALPAHHLGLGQMHVDTADRRQPVRGHGALSYYFLSRRKVAFVAVRLRACALAMLARLARAGCEAELCQLLRVLLSLRVGFLPPAGRHHGRHTGQRHATRGNRPVRACLRGNDAGDRRRRLLVDRSVCSPPRSSSFLASMSHRRCSLLCEPLQAEHKFRDQTEMNTRHVVFVDSTLAGLLAFKTARDMGCRVTFVEPLDSSFLALSTSDASRIEPHLAHVHAHIKLQTLANGALTDAIQRSQRHTGGAIVTTSEAAILHCGTAAQELGLLSPGRSELETAVFKDRCRAALMKAGLQSPRFEVMTEEQLLSRDPEAHSARPWSSSPRAASASSSPPSARRKTSSIGSSMTLKEAAAPWTDDRSHRQQPVHPRKRTCPAPCTRWKSSCVDGDVRVFATTTRYRSEHNDLLEMGYSMPAGLEPRKQARWNAMSRRVQGHGSRVRALSRGTDLWPERSMPRGD